MTTAQDLIQQLRLQPHPEGGYYRETYRSALHTTAASGAQRNVSTAIYYLLEDDDRSHFHRIQSDELWFFHQGQPIEVLLLENGQLTILTLGQDVARGEMPQAVVPAPESLPTFLELLAARGDEARMAMSIGMAVEQRMLEHPFDRPSKTYPDTKSWTWMKVAGELPDDQAVHAAALTFASDLSLLGAGTARKGGGWGRTAGSSLDHSVWFHEPVRTDEWFLYETDSPAASHGRALCFGQIWAVDGTHVATVTQQGLIRPLRG